MHDYARKVWTRAHRAGVPVGCYSFVARRSGLGRRRGGRRGRRGRRTPEAGGKDPSREGAWSGSRKRPPRRARSASPAAATGLSSRQPRPGRRPRPRPRTPAAFDPADVLNQPERRPAQRLDWRTQLRGGQTGDLSHQCLAVPLEVARSSSRVSETSAPVPSRSAGTCPDGCAIPRTSRAAIPMQDLAWTPMSTPTVTLNNGVEMPALGFGVFQTPPDETVAAVERGAARPATGTSTPPPPTSTSARSAKAIRRSGLARDEVFIETKVWISDYGYDATLHAFDKSARQARRRPDRPADPAPAAAGGVRPHARRLPGAREAARRRQGARDRREQLHARAPRPPARARRRSCRR